MNNPNVTHLLTLSSVYFITCILPGPDFINVTSHALKERKSGMLVAAGVTLGCGVWSTAAAFGLSIVSSSAFPFLKLLREGGALYLIYLGARTLYAAVQTRSTPLQIALVEHDKWSSFRCGFVTDITNPTLIAFFGGLFATTLPENSPVCIRSVSILVITFIAGVWHVCLAVLFSMKRTQHLYRHMKRPADLLLGAVLIGLGIRLAMT